MRLTFRVTLSALLVGLVTVGVAAITLVSFRLGRENANDLSAQVIDQTLHRIDLRIRSFLGVAVSQARMSQRLLETGQLAAGTADHGAPRAEDFERVTAHFAQAMQVQGGLTNLGVGLEADGAYCMVGRDAEGLRALEYVRLPAGETRVDLYRPSATGRRPVGTRPDDGYDPRVRPFFELAKARGAAAWTDAYLFYGAGGRERVPGVTYGAPIRGADGRVAAVLNADFDLFALCRFLDELRADLAGFAFVVELHEDGSRRPIAHPDPASLLHREASEGDEVETYSLAKTLDQVGDPRVRAFLAALPSLGRGTETSGQLEIEEGGEGYLGGYRLLGGADTPRWAICMMVPRGAIMEAVERNNRATLSIGLLAFGLAILLSLLVARLASRPLSRLAAQFAAIGRFELDEPPLGSSVILEIDRLMAASEEMKASLRSFERYVPARLVRRMVADGVEATLGGETRTLTVLFSHVRGFEELLAGLPAEELVEQLGEYFADFTEEIEATDGTLDKYIGDAVMAFWGAPQPHPTHALGACRAALAAQRRLAALRRAWEKAGRRTLRAGVGLNSGPLVVGNMGSERRLSYTVIGDAVNLAARLEGLNKVYGTEILMSERTRREVPDEVIARRIDVVAVKGKTEGVAVYELLGLAADRDPASEDARRLAQAYEDAFAHYEEQRFADAVAAFEALLAAEPGDGPSQLLLARCRAYLADPPPADWDGVYRMTKK